MEVSWLLILPLLYIIAALALISKRIAKQKPQPKLPPGPKPWPIIGNLNLIGSIPHQSFHFLSQKYGEIMLLKFGKFPVVVASSPEIAKQFLKIHDTVFASRPALAAGKRVVLRDHLMSLTLSTISRIAIGNKYFSELENEKSIIKMDELRGMLDEWFLLSGPKPWPIIGNLNLIGSIPHQSLHTLSQKYGEIMLLKFGKFPVVVASSPEMAKQFLKVHDTVFASRPALAAGKYTTYNYSDMTWAPYGPYWRQARKIYLSEVFSPKRLESFESIRMKERRNFLSHLRSVSGKPVVLRKEITRYTLSTISKMVFGDKYFSESENDKSMVKLDELQGMLDEWFFLNGVFCIGDWIPWLSFLDMGGYIKRMKALYKKYDRFHNYVIDDHLARRVKDKDNFIPKDAVDRLLLMAEDPNLEVKLTRDCVKGLLQDLLDGGTDTSATTIEWTIHEILRHPRILQQAKEELDRVIGRNRWVEENDFPQLPYIDAIIMESMRLHPLAPLLAPHYAMEDCKVAERFISKETDMLGSNFALLPFGSGRRRCPGYNLGLKIVRTTVANLVHGFELNVDGDICMEELYGLTVRPKESLAIIMEPTLPSHLY
ncbi:Cytochrome P450 CYP2 subfamily [Handroanthus impetiginosus]|uniref:Cytochrome P450 CYP2 subfamily n=1 Tax=Handroanthus impetiginosus TaxID=429701 RepID=A0A2G9GEA4_9LAMI|nr:Cytochrome P450 CYP2 subfamily [Handroanthus impetiginosus]